MSELSERIRFHFDENVNGRIVVALREYGIDVTRPIDVDLLTESDTTHWSFIKEEQRVIFTHDDDFLRLASEDQAHSGIVYCKMDTRSIGEMVRGLILIYEVLTAEEMHGHIEFL